MTEVFNESAWLDEQLAEKRNRMSSLLSALEDLQIQGLAVMAEVKFIEFEIADLLERKKIKAIKKYNEQLAAWGKNAPNSDAEETPPK